jgi:hypothetical protein
LADPDGKIARALGVHQLPTVLLIDPDGEIVQQWTALRNPGALASGIQQLLGGVMKNHPPTQLPQQ